MFFKIFADSFCSFGNNRFSFKPYFHRGGGTGGWDSHSCRETVCDRYSCREEVRESCKCREAVPDSSLLKKSFILLLQLMENLFFKKKWEAVVRCHVLATVDF